jgi:hypothetical protein
LPDRQKNGIYISLISLIYLLYLQSLKIIMASRLFHFRIRIRKDYCDYRRIFNLDLATFFSTGVTSRRIWAFSLLLLATICNLGYEGHVERVWALTSWRLKLECYLPSCFFFSYGLIEFLLCVRPSTRCWRFKEKKKTKKPPKTPQFLPSIQKLSV